MKGVQKYSNENNKQEQKIGKSSKVILQLTSGAVELKIRINKGDIQPGIYDVSFSCIDPGSSMIFPEALMVGEERRGELDTKIKLGEGLHHGCQVLVGTMIITFEPFTVTTTCNKAYNEDHRNKKIQQLVAAVESN